jgi:O-antigen/teichoic acid export membrane protein
MEILGFFTIMVVILVYFIYPYMVAEAYNQSKILIPIFLISSIFSILSTFFGTILLTYKLSNWISISTTIAAIISVLMNLIFMEDYGVIIFPIALLVAWIANALIRILIINKVMRFNPISLRFLIYIIMSTISLIVFDRGSSFQMVIIGTMVILMSLVMYYREIRSIFSWFRKGDFSGK